MLTTFLKNQFTEQIESLQDYGNAINEGSIIFITDSSGKIIYANEKLIEISHFSVEEFKEKNLENLISNQKSDLAKNEIWNAIKSGKHWHGELRQKTKDNNYYWLHSHILPVRNEKKEIVQYLAISTDITDKKENEYQIELLQQKIKIQEELLRTQVLQQNEISRLSMELHEKKWAEIGRELHDNINQLLVASNLYLKNIRTDVSNKDLIEKSILINTTAINKIRKLTWSLVPPSLNDLSLKDTIEEASHIFELTNAHFDIKIKIQEDTISEGLKINIYRIIQEQFNNIIKHSNATKVFVSLLQEKSICLEITDNGNGFDPKAKKNGIGIMNMIYRVESYNGTIKLESSPGKGCKLFIEFKNH